MVMSLRRYDSLFLRSSVPALFSSPTTERLISSNIAGMPPQATIQHWLQTNGSVCPITGDALAPEGRISTQVFVNRPGVLADLL